MLLIFPPPLALDGGKDNAPSTPIGLPSAIISSIVTVILYLGLLGTHARAKGLQPRCITSRQKTRIALQCLPLGLFAGGVLAILELSLRWFSRVAYPSN